MPAQRRRPPQAEPERAAIVRWIACLGAVTAEALAAHGGVTVASARGRLRAGEGARLLRSRRPLLGQPALYTVTPAGLRAAGLSDLDPCRVSASNALHLITCAGVAVALERSYPDQRVQGERELRREHRRLPIAVETGDEMVEADLADGDQARVAGVARERIAQRRDVTGAGAVGAHRMDAERVGEPMPMRQFPHPLEVGDGYRRDDDLGDSGDARPRDDGVAIGIELGRVEVAMRVDPHGTMMPARAPRPSL